MRQDRDLAPFSLTLIDGRPTIRGDCDFAAARDIESWLATFDAQPLEVDLSGVTFFDSSALRAFLNVHRPTVTCASSLRAKPYSECSRSPAPSNTSSRDATSFRDGA